MSTSPSPGRSTRHSSAIPATVRTPSRRAWSTQACWGARRAGASTSTAMASGRVFVAGASGDALLGWLRLRLRESGYDPLALAPAGEDAGAAPISLDPVVAGFDLWRTAGEERFEALAALDELLPPGRPLLSLCNAISADEAASYAVRAERVLRFSL